MEKLFHFLTAHPYFKKRISFLHYDYYYFSSDEASFQARIFIPKDEKHIFSWYYYDEASQTPEWFLKLVDVSFHEVEKRDRIRRLF
jgi:hypothetical protein